MGSIGRSIELFILVRLMISNRIVNGFCKGLVVVGSGIKFVILLSIFIVKVIRDRVVFTIGGILVSNDVFIVFDFLVG